MVIGGRRTELLDRLAAEHPGLHTVVIDTSDAASTAAAAEEVMRRFPRTDVLVPMAGIMLPEDLHSPDFLPTAEATIATNLLGPVRLIAHFTPFLAGQDAAVIMTVSSGLAFVPLPATPTCNATKAAVHSFTESLRVQLADTGIQVVELVPPAVRTPLMGQRDDERAMPLPDSLDEALALIERDPRITEVLVERVTPLRHAEADGSYARVLAALSRH